MDLKLATDLNNNNASLLAFPQWRSERQRNKCFNLDQFLYEVWSLQTRILQLLTLSSLHLLRICKHGALSSGSISFGSLLF